MLNEPTGRWRRLPATKVFFSFFFFTWKINALYGTSNSRLFIAVFSFCAPFLNGFKTFLTEPGAGKPLGCIRGGACICFGCFPGGFEDTEEEEEAGDDAWLLLQIQTFICGKIRTDAQFSVFVQCSSSCTTAKLIHKANTN